MKRFDNVTLKGGREGEGKREGEGRREREEVGRKKGKRGTERERKIMRTNTCKLSFESLLFLLSLSLPAALRQFLQP